MRRRRCPEPVAEYLAAVPSLLRLELIELWTEAYEKPPSKGLSRRLLEYSAAYQVQAKAYGGLSRSQRIKLRRAQMSGGVEPSESKTKAATANRPPPGTRLVREWHGKTYTVEVLETGFQCDGQQYRSLSEVARAITGARWSGPRFFGL